MKKYGIMGGTFNPIHLGHLMMSEYVRVDFDLDEIIFVPTGNPPHKDNIVNSKNRYEMTSLAISDNNFFSISDVEVVKKDTCYSIDTVLSLKKLYSGKFYFIIGSDTLFQLKTWKKLDELSKEVEFICSLRPEYTDDKTLEIELNFLKKNFNTTVNIAKTPQYEISSTELRDRILNGKSVKYLIPDRVKKYIDENNLYRG